MRLAPLASSLVFTLWAVRPALAPLRLPGFRPLALAYTVNELGNWLGEIALAVLVFEQTGNALATAALFIGMQFVPAVFAQGLVARMEVTGTRIGMPITYGAEGLTFLALALLADDFLLPLVVALAALDGALALTSRAFTRAAVAATLTPSGLLREGNAILNIGFTLAGALGPLIAGLVVAGIGAREALLLDAASFLFVAVVLVLSRSVPNVKAEPDPWQRRLREGLAYVAARPVLRRLLEAQALAFIFFAIVIPIEIVYAKMTLDAGDTGYGALLASWGAGMVVGSFVFAAARRISLQVLLLVSTVTIGLAYIGMSVAGTIVIACVAAAIGGAGNGVQWVAIVSAIQGLTDSKYQARVISLLETSGFLMPGFGFMIGGAVAYLIDPRASFLVAGLGVLAVTAVALPKLRRVEWPSASADAEQAVEVAAEAPATAQAVRGPAAPEAEG